MKWQMPGERMIERCTEKTEGMINKKGDTDDMNTSDRGGKSLSELVSTLRKLGGMAKK